LAVNVVVEVELDTMMYLEDDPPQFKVWLHVNPVRFAAHR
jgi:hypothetical protein